MARFGRKKSNWDTLRNMDVGDTVQNRDVYESQNLERSRLRGAQTNRKGNLGAAAVGIVIFLMVWFVLSVVTMMVATLHNTLDLRHATAHVASYYTTKTAGFTNTYCPTDAHGYLTGGKCYASSSAVPVPAWHKAAIASARAHATHRNTGFAHAVFSFPWWKLLLSLLPSAFVFSLLQKKFARLTDAQNLNEDTTDINQYDNDQHVALPEEIMAKFVPFPDSGAIADAPVSSMISHVALSNKGIKQVPVSLCAEADVLDEDGDVIMYKGEILRDDNGVVKTKKMPLFDEKFAQALFEASGIPLTKDTEHIRKFYDPTQISYNPGNKYFDKPGVFDTWADLINETWEFPEYEVQRPGGAYIVDTAPVNTMVLAITRGGKGEKALSVA